MVRLVFLTVASVLFAFADFSAAVNPLKLTEDTTSGLEEAQLLGAVVNRCQ